MAKIIDPGLAKPNAPIFSEDSSLFRAQRLANIEGAANEKSLKAAEPDQQTAKKSAQHRTADHSTAAPQFAKEGKVNIFTHLPATAFATFGVSWGYDTDVGLVLTHRSWNRILHGGAVTLRGKGYSYEGLQFQDIWHFSDGLDGYLEVNYGSRRDGDYSGQGYRGTPRQALLATKDSSHTRLPPENWEIFLEHWQISSHFRSEKGQVPPTLHRPKGHEALKVVEPTAAPTIPELPWKKMEAAPDHRHLDLAPFAVEIDRTVSAWRAQQANIAGLAAGRMRSYQASVIRRHLEDHCLSNGKMPVGRQTTSTLGIEFEIKA